MSLLVSGKDPATGSEVPFRVNSSGELVTGSASGGAIATFELVSAASTNATVVKASPGRLHGYYIYNSNAAARKVVLHNSATTPTAGANVKMPLVIPPGGGANLYIEKGIPFAAGIAITTVTGLADSDATAVGLNDLVINLFYE